MDTIRPISHPRDTDGQMASVSQQGRNSSVDVRNDVAVSGNDVPAESRFIQELSDTSLSKAIGELTSHAQSINRDLEFSVDENLNRTVITVYDSATEEVIRQIPSEEVIALARHLSEQQGNVLIRLKA
jgi:flagellar protein FlaG